MNKRIWLPVWFLFAGAFLAFSQDAVYNTIKGELSRNFEILQKQTIPAYYGFIRLDEINSISASARLGKLQSEAMMNTPYRVLSSGLRVGDHQLDNSHEIREAGMGGLGLSTRASYIPYEDNSRVIKNAIWKQLDALYKEGAQTYEHVKANMAVKVEQEDKSPDFSIEKVENYYEKPISWQDLRINPKELEDKVRKYSAVFDRNEDIRDGSAYIIASLSRKIFIDTEGREMSQNAVNLQLVLTADVLADDGMNLPLTKTWLAFSMNEFPSDEEVVRAAQDMSDMLSALKDAPVVESFTGPAILSPAASGVFFHEIFGHRIEGSRLKQEMDAQTFKKKVGEPVLPKHLSVTFDPTQKYFQSTPLAGNYVFDDEGIKSQKVEVIKDGVLKNFLMSRTPIEGFSHSNGHGRAAVGMAPISRQSNMFIESSQKYSEKDLLERLRKEAKSQGKEYAYYFKEVAGGFTNTNRYSPNSFNVTPLVVYRIYVDGRPDELVRGVDMVGTPLAMFSQIDACGNEYSVFNGVCGAESGSIPVACISPALFVKQIETQKRAKSQTQPPLLPKPQVATSSNTNSGDEIVLKSIKEEVNRSLQNLKMDGLQKPFFIAYTIGDTKQLSVAASYGSLIGSAMNHSRGSTSRLLIGDYQCTDENFQGGGSGGAYYDGSPTLDNDEQGIRTTIWKDLDAIYKRAAETYEQKIASVKQLNIPAEELELPDWDQTPVVVKKDISHKPFNYDRAGYEAYVKEASSVFKDYANIIDANVSLQLIEGKAYFYNTEGTEFIYPMAFVFIDGAVSAKTDEGEDIQASFDHVFAHPDELPSLDQIKAECRKLAESLIEKMEAPKLKESYSGPVLFEKKAVNGVFYPNFFGGDISLIASRKPISSSGYSYGGNSIEEMMDKRITAREITIEDMTGTKEYKGVKLIGYAPIDAEGVVPPEKITLVENGILKTLLSDRVPTPKVPHSNGHALFGANLSSNVNTGVIRLSDTRTKKYEELKKELLTRAQEEGYEYAYIVRDASGEGGYPTELYQVSMDGTEKRIRSAVIPNVDAQVFKNIVAVSDEEQIYNTFGGNLLTIITPSAILFEEMQIQSDRIDNFQKAPLVPASK